MFTVFKIKKKKSFGNYAGQNPLQIFDLLQLSRQERESRDACLQIIRQLKLYKEVRLIDKKRDDRLISARLRRDAQNAVLFYRLTKAERMRAFRDYMQKLPTVQRACGVMS